MIKYDYIELMFENGTSSGKLSVGNTDYANVCEIYLHDIKRNIGNVNFCDVVEFYEAKAINIILNKSSDIRLVGRDKKFTLFERIMSCPDIAYINLYSNRNIDTIFVPWNKKNKHYNTYQTANIKNDLLYLQIS